MIPITPTPPPEPEQRLPCRGCMSNCPNYAHCEGKLWRAKDGNVPNAQP